MINYKTREKTPCRLCEDREPACHSRCEKYIAWKEECNEENNKFWESVRVECAMKSLSSERKIEKVKKTIRNRR